MCSIDMMKFIIPAGFNVLFWGLVGAWRRWHDAPIPSLTRTQRTKATAAICLAAHNEAETLEQTLASLKRLAPANRIFVISDGSTDTTAELAARAGCSVLELAHGRGKAAALEAGIKHFNLLNRFRYLMIADADTIFESHFLDRAISLHETDPSLAVVFAYERPLNSGARSLSFWEAYRTRLWIMLQTLITYGQAWGHTNVYPVVPGYANVYRTSVLRQLTIAVPGTIIEDFNLAFQIHKKRLGSIIVHPSLQAFTQNPATLTDYWLQVLRWNIGFFQAIKQWGFWPSRFWAALLPFIFENIIIAIIGHLIPTIATLAVLVSLPGGPTWQTPAVQRFLPVAVAGLLGFVITDYAVTLVIALRLRSKQLAWYGLGFLFVHYINCIIFMYAIPKGLLTTSDGRWTSPVRQPISQPERSRTLL